MKDSTIKKWHPELAFVSCVRTPYCEEEREMFTSTTISCISKTRVSLSWLLRGHVRQANCKDEVKARDDFAERLSSESRKWNLHKSFKHLNVVAITEYYCMFNSSMMLQVEHATLLKRLKIVYTKRHGGMDLAVMLIHVLDFNATWKWQLWKAASGKYVVIWQIQDILHVESWTKTSLSSWGLRLWHHNIDNPALLAGGLHGSCMGGLGSSKST